MTINSQNKRHFTYITQFTIHFFLTHVPHVNYSNHGKKRRYTMKVTKHSTKLFWICCFFNFFCCCYFDKVTCDVKWTDTRKTFPVTICKKFHVFPEKSLKLLTASVLCLWLLVIHSGCVLMMSIFRHFYSFLKWNRIIGDSRVGQDNRRSQIALQSKFKSSFCLTGVVKCTVFFLCVFFVLFCFV